MKKKTDYTAFHKQLDIDFKNEPEYYKDKETLEYYLRLFGYRVKDGDKLNPKEKQLEHAWKYLNDRYGQQKLKTEDIFIWRYKGSTRASKTFTYKDKIYRRGQFLPKEYVRKQELQDWY